MIGISVDVMREMSVVSGFVVMGYVKSNILTFGNFPFLVHTFTNM